MRKSGVRVRTFERCGAYAEPRRGGAHVPLQPGDVDEGYERNVPPLAAGRARVHAVGVGEAVALVRVRACVGVWSLGWRVGFGLAFGVWVRLGVLTSGCAEAGAEAARTRCAYGGGSADRPEAGGSTWLGV